MKFFQIPNTFIYLSMTKKVDLTVNYDKTKYLMASRRNINCGQKLYIGNRRGQVQKSVTI